MAQLKSLSALESSGTVNVSSLRRQTIALSGAPPLTLAKRALLIGASVLERGVGRLRRRTRQTVVKDVQ